MLSDRAGLHLHQDGANGETHTAFVDRCIRVLSDGKPAPADEDYTRKSAKSIDESVLDLCVSWANNRSKDPNTKVGAAVYDPVTGGVFLGYNGFPKGIADLNSRWQNRNKDDPNAKYPLVVHAERNALRKAGMALGENVARCVLYCTHKPCGPCMVEIAAYGIKRVAFSNKHWDDPLTDKIAQEAKVTLDWITVDS
jgi:deoxycytidylate deaminase